MKILFLTYGNEETASSRIRVYQYLPYLKNIKYRVIPYNRFSCRFFRRLGTAISLAELIVLSPFFDTIFMQKVVLPHAVCDLLLKMKKRILYDMDDLLTANPRLYNGHSCRAILSGSDHVLLASDYNIEFVRRFNKNVSVIIGPVDCRRYAPVPVVKECCIVGWIGSPATEKYLNVISKVLQKIAETYNVRLEFIGAAHSCGPAVIKEWSLGSEVENLRRFDIGLMPLTDDEWARGKGGYKILQYMALGIPTVASPVGINNNIVTDGVTGYLCKNEGEWLEKLDLLIKDPLARARMGEAARKTVTAGFSLERTKDRFIGILKGAAAE